jgi:hypothetical protein
MRKKSKERYKYLHSAILRGAEESATGKSTSSNDNNRIAKESTTGKTNDRQTKHKRNQALLFCPLSNPNSYFSFLF